MLQFTTGQTVTSLQNYVLADNQFRTGQTVTSLQNYVLADNQFRTGQTLHFRTTYSQTISSERGRHFKLITRWLFLNTKERHRIHKGAVERTQLNDKHTAKRNF
jgi:hypothetical protein